MKWSKSSVFGRNQWMNGQEKSDAGKTLMLIRVHCTRYICCDKCSKPIFLRQLSTKQLISDFKQMKHIMRYEFQWGWDWLKSEDRITSNTRQSVNLIRLSSIWRNSITSIEAVSHELHFRLCLSVCFTKHIRKSNKQINMKKWYI